MQRLLLLMTTTTYRAQAFLEAAKRLDIPVTVGSERAQALAAVNPAGHLTLDFSAPEEGHPGYCRLRQGPSHRWRHSGR